MCARHFSMQNTRNTCWKQIYIVLLVLLLKKKKQFKSTQLVKLGTLLCLNRTKKKNFDNTFLFQIKAKIILYEWTLASLLKIYEATLKAMLSN